MVVESLVSYVESDKIWSDKFQIQQKFKSKKLTPKYPEEIIGEYFYKSGM